MGYVFVWGRNILVVIGLIAIITAIVVGICVWQLVENPALEARMDKFELNEAQVASLASSFDEKVMNIKDKVDIGNFESEEPFTFTLTEEEVTAKLLDEIKKSSIPLDISGAWVNFTYDEEDERYEVWILSKVDIGFVLTSGLEFLLVAENGILKITLEGDGLGLKTGEGPGFPEGVEHQIAGAMPMEEVFTGILDNLPVYFSEIQISDGEITFIGNFK